jgi:allene oxide cyclase
MVDDEWRAKCRRIYPVATERAMLSSKSFTREPNGVEVADGARVLHNCITLLLPRRLRAAGDEVPGENQLLIRLACFLEAARGGDLEGAQPVFEALSAGWIRLKKSGLQFKQFERFVRMRKSSVCMAGLLTMAADVGVTSAAETLTVVEKVASEKTVDIGPKGDSMGDVLVFANPIFDAAGSLKIGSDEGHCLRTVVGKTWDCTWTLILKDGQIMATGPILDNADSSMAIIGGTGKYAGAMGTLLVHPKNETSYEFKYQLM